MWCLMPSLTFVKRGLLILIFGIGLVPHGVTFAADKKEVSEIDYPLVVLNAASLQRLRDNAGLMFETAERADMTDRVDQWTAETLKETKGIDRTRPFGMMLYLNTESLIRPIGISYLPVTNLEDALQTLAYGTGTIVPIEGKANRHEIVYTDNFKIRTLYQGNYLFVVGPDGNDTTLDFNFPEPEKLVTRLTAQYDIAISCLIKSIPPGMKLLALQAFKSQAIADLQQRDDEPVSVYRLRRANGEGWVELLDKVINQGEEFTIGGRIDLEKKIANIDIEIAGSKDSKLAKLFQNMAGKRTYFGNLVANPSTFTMSVSWLLDEQQRKLFITYFEAAQRDLAKSAVQDAAADLGKIVDPIFKTLMTTADVGHLDAIAQLTGTEQGGFVLLGGVKLATSRNLPTQIEQLLTYVKENPNGNELMEKLELSAEVIDSFPVHRLPIDPPDKTGQRMFGESAQLYLYASPQAVWLAFGGETALDSLKQGINAVALPQGAKPGRNRVPFQFVTHAKNWLSVSDTENPAAEPFNERARASFEADNDAMTLEIRPTDRGVRIRLEFEGGYLGLMGRGVTNGIENGFFQPGQRGPGGRRPGGNRPNTPPTPPQTNN